MSWSSNIKPDIDDNWGCVDPAELFLGVGKTQPLRFLVDQLVKKGEDKTKSGYKSGVQENNLWRSSLGECGSSSVNGSNHVQQSSSSNSMLMMNGRKTAPKILKQKRGLMERIPSLKRVTFEVEKFVVNSLQAGSEKESAAARMAVSLGAIPIKSKSVNYKKLKADRQQKDSCGIQDVGSDFLRSFRIGSKKVQKKKSSNNISNKKKTKKQLRKAKKASRK